MIRQARFDDHWRHAYARPYPTRFTEVTLTGLRSLADGTIRFTGGLNAIVGSNGAGKSTLVAAIAQLLASDPNSPQSFDEGYQARLRGSTIQGVAFREQQELHLAVKDDATGLRIAAGEGFGADVRWLDPSTRANRCLHKIQTDPNFNDLLEPLTPLQLEPHKRNVASYLVGKHYTDIKIFEITDYAGFDLIPYFRVSSGGIEYGSEGMGRGEFSLLLTYWTLLDMDKNSILLLEEPETHVSPRSQDCLMNIIAKFSDEMGIWVIVTTHSPTVIHRIPREHVKLLVRNDGPAALVTTATKLDIALLLGGGVAYRGLILVEDEAAKEFLRGLFEKLDAEMLRQFDIVVAGSASNISAILNSMPEVQKWLTLFGAYDGDMRTKIDESEFNWSYGYLPGVVGTEEMLTELTHGVPDIASLLEAEIGVSAGQIMLAMDHAAGVGHHDYFIEFAKAVNLHVSAVRRGFVRIWLRNEVNMKAAQSFIDEVREVSKRE